MVKIEYLKKYVYTTAKDRKIYLTRQDRWFEMFDKMTF